MSLAAAKPVIFVNVGDKEGGRAFYRDLLGLTLRSSDDFGDAYDFPGALLRITPLADHQAHAHPVLGWDVPNIYDTVRALGDKGITCTIYDGFGQDELGVWTAPDGKTRVAWFADPFGNVLSLSENA